MDIFFIKESEDLPEIKIDPNAGKLEFVGKSLPEDPTAFYIPVEAAVREYIKSPKPVTTIELRLEYLNSSSQKRILEILSLFEKIISDKTKVYINWYYPGEDEDILEEGRDIAKILKLPVNLIPE